MKITLSRRFSAAILFACLVSCGGLPKDFPKEESHTLSNTSGTALGRAAKSEVARHGRKAESGLYPLGSGLDAFVARAVLAEKAQRSIDAQYYLLNEDLSGRLFVHHLLKAADRGVRVRLLVDDMGLGGRDLAGSALDGHPNVEVRVFNPFSRGSSRMLQMVTRFGNVTRRMHNKTYTVDGHIAVIGGRNIGDEYFAANPNLNFGDLDTIVIGPAVDDIAKSFDAYWNDELAYPMRALYTKRPMETEVSAKKQALATAISTPEATRYREALKNSELANRLQSGGLIFEWGKAQVVSDSPDKISSPRSASELHLTTQLKPYFEATEKELILLSPYFVPTKAGTEALAAMERRGVQVRVLTNSLAATDVAAVHAGYKKYRKDLLRAGVELYELDREAEQRGGRDVHWLGGSSKSSLHAKSFVLDRRHVFIGSFNFDPRSAKENTEVGIIVDSPEIGEKFASNFEKKVGGVAFRLELKNPGGFLGGKLLWHQTKDGVTETFTKDPHTSFLKRLNVGLIGLLPIESQL